MLPVTAASSRIFQVSETGGRMPPSLACWKRVAATAIFRWIRAAPRPIFRSCAQSRLYRIIYDIRAKPRPFGVIANPVIVTFLLPEMFAGALEQLVRFRRRK